MALLKIPQKLPLLFIQEDILLPGSTMRVPIHGSTSINMVKSRLLSRNSLASTIIGVVTVEDQKSFEDNFNTPDLMMIGTAAFVLQVTGSMWSKSNTMVIYLLGVCRFSLDKLVMEEPYPVGVVTQLDYSSSDEDSLIKTECHKLAEEIRKCSLKILKNMDQSNASVYDMIRTIKSAPVMSLPDLAMAVSNTSYAEKSEIQYNLDLEQRMRKVLPILHKQLQMIKQKKESEIHKSQTPEATVLVLAIPKNIRGLQGEPRNFANTLMGSSDNLNEIDELQKKIENANLPPEVNKVVSRDLQRLRRMGPFSPEHSIIRSYIEYVVELPWTVASPETIDIPKARNDLDADHYGMDKVKQRVLEYLAVRRLRPGVRGPVLCFVGPPGVGKTSIGRSIARTLGRKFQRISLGGVSNQSEIRGHRRTYIGAMPGRIIQAIRNAGVNNPVILLDEIDKMGQGVHGAPSAALLEVLDPLQNNHFVDHYINVPFDLSQVTFIATANESRRIPAPLLDRMETISVPGYTVEEKVHIAERHLLPKQIKENGLTSDVITVPEDSLKQLIRNYTAEAGVRNLERNIGAVCRAVTVKVAEEDSVQMPVEVTTPIIEETLGPPVYCELDVWSRVGAPGVAVGLSWTYRGGSLLLVEATKLEKGSGKLTLTGQLGNVMQESARLALNWVRSIANQYGLVGQGEELMSDIDVHIHFPEGAVGKEGPSAGVTIATALVSLFSNTPLISGLAMSGEMTLRGFVLPVGGVREKVLAAHRAGFKKVILPKLCIKDLFYIPQNVKDEMSFLFVSHMEEVIEAAFDRMVTPASETQSSTLQSHL